MAQDVFLPDTGSNNAVDIIEVQVKTGDTVEKGQTLLTLESDKATIDVPSPDSGKITALLVKKGGKVKSGDLICRLDTRKDENAPAKKTVKEIREEAPVAPPTQKEEIHNKIETPDKADHLSPQSAETDVLAGPAVRRLARLLGVNLAQVKGSGQNGRLTKEDVQAHVKNLLSGKSSGNNSALPSMPDIDFAQFGPIEAVPLTRIKRLTAQNLGRNWLLAPHVTQFDEADITEMEAFRKKEAPHYEKQGMKLTPLVFIMKAVVNALKTFPQFNASLDASGENLIYKKYYHLGIAVDTPEGLVVPVIRNVDQKNLSELASELAQTSKKAREKKLSAQDMQGSTFTISSLGGIGGSAFTPIINLPNVAILGVSKSLMKPEYDGDSFQPRLMLPLSLSYDHRVIDGAEGARFIVHLSHLLGDLRRLLL